MPSSFPSAAQQASQARKNRVNALKTAYSVKLEVGDLVYNAAGLAEVTNPAAIDKESDVRIILRKTFLENRYVDPYGIDMPDGKVFPCDRRAVFAFKAMGLDDLPGLGEPLPWDAHTQVLHYHVDCSRPRNSGTYGWTFLIHVFHYINRTSRWWVYAEDDQGKTAWSLEPDFEPNTGFYA